MARDEFPIRTKRTLAIRAAHFCSNPQCLKLTAGPHSNEAKSLTTGHAGHIHAAAPNGPRYDPNQTSAQRKSIANGIWLCRECGDIVDKDDCHHSVGLLREWKSNHETLIAEVRTAGYSKSLELLQSKRIEPIIARKIITFMEDRRVLWQTFDAEFPDRVRRSLDDLRLYLVNLQSELNNGSPLGRVLLSLVKTIHVFFNMVEHSDLAALKCNCEDPEWRRFSDALAVLRKAIGLQIDNLANVYGIEITSDLKSIVPSKVEP